MKRIAFAAIVVMAPMMVPLSAAAGTKGGLYNMQHMLNQGHPFDSRPASGYAAPAAPMPASSAPPPPPPIGRAPVAAPARMAQRQPAPRYDSVGDGGFTEGWFDRLYFSIGGFYHIPDDIDASVLGGGSATIETDSGFMLNAALGKYLYEDIRAEIELAVRQADCDKAVIGAASSTGNGDLNLTTVMLNGYYDIKMGWPVTPYVGAGVGVGFIDGTNVSVGASRVLGPDTTEFAYQGIVGASYPMSPRWSLGLEARYLGAGGDYSAVDGGVVVRFNM